MRSVAYPGIFSRREIPGVFFGGGGVPTYSVEDRGQREWGSGGISPHSGVPLNLKMSETHILIRLLWMYFPWNWVFGSALSKLRNFQRGGFEPPPPLGMPLNVFSALSILVNL
jgi:hypothetical protein